MCDLQTYAFRAHVMECTEITILLKRIVKILNIYCCKSLEKLFLV